MKKNKILILMKCTNNFDKYFIDKMRKVNIDVEPIFKFRGQLLIYLMEIHMRLNLPSQSLWYCNWKNSLSKYNTVIIFDSLPTENIVSYIHSINPHCRIIYWYWNKVKKMPKLVNKDFCEYWSFDIKDCTKYNLNYNNQFYFSNINLKPVYLKYQGCFIGADKGRLKQLRELEHKLNLINITTKFIVIKDKRKLYKKSENCKSKMINYAEVLDIINQSGAIIDITKKNQFGLTLRFMEAIFYKKKLITNNKSVLDSNLYNNNNIFIINYNRWNDIQDFLQKPYVNLSKNILSQYKYESWIKNFEVNDEKKSFVDVVSSTI